MGTFSGGPNADTLNGTDQADTINGGGGNDILNGLGGNDTLIGGTGNDQMTGGAGNDTYVVDALADLVVELAGGGIDTIKSSISITALAAEVEKLLLTGTGALNGTGNALNNTLTGNSAVNRLYGLGGNDTLNGGTGDDWLYGGLGNDSFIVNSAGDKVVENLGEGTDTVKASLGWTLGNNLEKLVLTGTAAINGTGNALANTLTGNSAANTLSGLDGNDTLVGGAGADKLVGGKGMDTATGGIGNDVFAFSSALDTWAWDDFSSVSSRTGADTITDFQTGDLIDLSGIDAVSSPSGHNISGDQKFVFIGTNGFHSHTAREIRYEIVGGNTYVYGNINGDRVADFVIKLDGTHTLTSADFTL